MYVLYPGVLAISMTPGYQQIHGLTLTSVCLLQNNKILPQLVYHGKKTVPAALRRDHWTPYFSLHFPPSEYGASSGLLAYHQLRELSKQRQLAPPEDMVITTQEDIDRMKARYEPAELGDMIKDRELKLPKVGQLLPKELRARKLMSQKTTSVADVAFVLGLQADGPDPREAARLKEERRKEWWNNISRGAKTRARRREKLREGKEEQLEARRKMAMKADKASLGLNPDTATRIAMETQGAIFDRGHQVDVTKHGHALEEEEIAAAKRQQLEEGATVEADVNEKGSASTVAEMTGPGIQTRKSPSLRMAEPDSTEAAEREAAEATRAESPAAARAEAMRPRDPKEVRVLWADLRDAAYAEQWPETVVHAELERMAVAKARGTKLKGGQHALPVKSRSVHVIGGQKGSGWYLGPAEIEELERGRKEEAEALERKRKRKAGELETNGEAGEEGGPEGEEGEKKAVPEGSESKKEHKKREDAAESLRKEGIEVETPRRSLWAKATGLFGR